MTALDQAFIKAFTQQNTSPLAALPPPVTLPPPAAPAAKQGFARGDDADDGAIPPKTEDRPEKIRAKAKDRPGPERRAGSRAPSRPNPKPSVPSLAETAAAPATATRGGVWAALERSPKAVTNLRQTDGGPERLQPQAEEEREASNAARGEASAPAAVASLPASYRFAESVSASLGAWSLPPAVGEEMESGAPVPADYAGFAPAGSEQAPRVLPTLAASPPTPQPFKSGWQVDQFTWPRLCRRLIARAAGELDRLADALMAANMQGQKVLAVAGYHRGEGATTLLLCAARRLAERGIKPVLVDADLAQPRLAKRLGVQPQFGWDETEEEEGRSLDQAIVEATANNVALLPAREPSAEGHRPAGDPARLPVCLGILREHYDMVLVDLGPLEEAESAQDAMRRTARLVDAVVLVRNHRLTSAERLAACQEQLTEAGTVVVGIVENFGAAD